MPWQSPSYFVVLKAKFSLVCLKFAQNFTVSPLTTTNTGAGAPPFFYLLFWEEDCQTQYFSSAASIVTDTPWPASPTTYKLQMWLLQMVSWKRHTITNWNGAGRVAGLPGMAGKCYESSSDKVNRECMWMCSLFKSLTVKQTERSLGKCQSQYEVQVALIKTETRLFSSWLFFFFKDFPPYCNPGRRELPRYWFCRQEKTPWSKIHCNERCIPSISSAHGDQSVLGLSNLDVFFLLRSMLEWLVIFKRC